MYLTMNEDLGIMRNYYVVNSNTHKYVKKSSINIAAFLLPLLLLKFKEVRYY